MTLRALGSPSWRIFELETGSFPLEGLPRLAVPIGRTLSSPVLSLLVVVNDDIGGTRVGEKMYGGHMCRVQDATAGKQGDDQEYRQ